MKAEKSIIALGLEIASLASLMLCTTLEANNKSKKNKKPTTFEISEDTQWVLDCLDDIVIDIKQMHKQQDEQSERLKVLEMRIDNVNSRVDSVVGGK